MKIHLVGVSRQILFTLLLLGCLTSVQAGVPFANDLAVEVEHYNRATPWLATGAAPPDDKLTVLKEAGLVNLVDLRRPAEGTEAMREAAMAAGLTYFNLPLGRERPEAALIQAVAEILDSHKGEPTLLYCASGNRAGTVWAMYRVQQGVPVELAVEEGLTAGMAAERAQWIRDWSNELARTDKAE